MLRHAVAVWSAVVMAGASAPALAQSLSLLRHDFPSVAGARGIVAADFDRNGWVDLAHANLGKNSVTVLLNQGRGTPAFLKVYDVPVGLGPFGLVAADLNTDGLTDLAVANADSHSVSVLTGRAGGGFARTDFSVPRGPRGITSADVNKDGKVDLIVTGWDSNSVQVLFGNGSGGFTSGPAFVGYSAHPQGVAAADFNRDGHLDLVVAYDSSGGLAVLERNGERNFALRAVTGHANLNVVATGDFNRDGRIDVAAASTSWSRVAVYLNGAAGLKFTTAYTVGVSPRGLIAADVNHDGILDLATANRGSSTVSVLLGSASAPGSFAPAETFAAGVGSRALAAVDFDRDGRLDIAAGSEYGSSVSVLWNEMSFRPAAYSFDRQSLGTPSTAWGGGNRAWPADFNEDGQLDVLTMPDWRVGSNSLSLLVTGRPDALLTFPHFITSFATGDYNNDGHADVLGWHGYETVTMSVLLGSGSGAFRLAPSTRSALRFWGGGDSAGDLNRDGNLDLVFTGYDPATGTSIVQTMNGVGDGTFRHGTRIATSEFVVVPRIADVNGDGNPDVAALDQGALTVWPGDGAGGLGAPSRTPWPHRWSTSLEFADINHDGLLDACTSDNEIVVAIATASGFAPAALVVQDPQFNGWRTVGVADLDLDGNLDIVTDTGIVLRGHGDGTFRDPDFFQFAGSNVHVGDFNRDGLPDLFLATSQGAVDVIVNGRNDVNHAPAVSAGPDVTIDYARQFDDSEPSLAAVGVDPDLHALTYEWRDQEGKLIHNWGPWLPIYGNLPGRYTYTVTAFDGRGASARDSVVVTVAPTKEIVLWAANGFVNGNWTIVPDSTAAGGRRGYDRNAGAPKVMAPLATTNNTIELSFIADPTQNYKLWIRLKADANHWSNDSVWVQFSGAADASGTPIYRIGTTSGRSVNLEECSGCGISGWGWEDDAWGAVDRNGATLRFPGGGPQRIQLQTREDGVSIDQVVLSAEKYLNVRPGRAKDDATVLQATYWPSYD